MIARRGFINLLPALSLAGSWPHLVRAQAAPTLSPLKAGYATRLKKILAAGELPYIDIESSCNSKKLDMDTLAKHMDSLNIGLMALSADIGKGQFDKGVRFDDLSARLLASYPDRFIAVGNGGQGPAWTEATDEFLDAQESAAKARTIELLGEYEFRHYPSPRQLKRGEVDRDESVPIDGPIGHRVFSLSEKTGLSFQIHYEIENELLTPLEAMLQQYPNAKVIWCHVAQVRYAERASRYSPAYVEGLIKRFPNLYFDTAFGSANSVYAASQQRHSRVWALSGGLDTAWWDLIVAHSSRFLSALDLGGDRMDLIAERDQHQRNFLKHLPRETQHQVAYRSAWTLLFGEEFA